MTKNSALFRLMSCAYNLLHRSRASPAVCFAIWCPWVLRFRRSCAGIFAITASTELHGKRNPRGWNSIQPWNAGCSVGKMRFDKGCPSPRICHGYLFPQIRRLYRSADICFLQMQPALPRFVRYNVPESVLHNYNGRRIFWSLAAAFAGRFQKRFPRRMNFCGYRRSGSMPHNLSV